MSGKVLKQYICHEQILMTHTVVPGSDADPITSPSLSRYIVFVLSRHAIGLFLAASAARPALMIALLFLFLFLLAFSSFCHLSPFVPCYGTFCATGSLKVFLCRATAHFVPSRGT
jgi:hypothetical protein